MENSATSSKLLAVTYPTCFTAPKLTTAHARMSALSFWGTSNFPSRS